MLAADDVPCVECGLIPSDCRPDRIVEAMPEWAHEMARGAGVLAGVAAPPAVVATMALCLSLGVPGSFGEATEPAHPLRQPMNQAVALMSAAAVSLSLHIGSWIVRSASRRAPQIQSIRWVGRLSLVGVLASGACCTASAIAWIPVWGLTRDVTGPAEAVAALSLLFALGAVVGFVGRVGAIIGAPWMKASRRALRIAWFVAIVSAVLLPLAEYRFPPGSATGAMVRAVPALLLTASVLAVLAWLALMLSVAGHVDARLRARDRGVHHQPLLMAAAVACAVTLVNWRVGVRVDHAHQVGSGAGPVVAWMVVLAPGAAAWFAGALSRSIQIGLAAGVGVVAAALIWAVAT
jgi:hypothetical protein